ncbi:MAG TPA: phospho-N-acetylmuramoyl-pentapeptide-transferase [Thermoleophilia bacterium]|nr:phospho-N-acetylmuramoyl-pentapeptide-transferase [Thermoleophilia bacterium]
MIRVLAAGLLAMVLAVVAGPRFIRWLRDRGIGQNIRDVGPERHQVKQGTPTMGGLLILAAAAIPYMILARKTVPSLVVFVLTFGSGAIGLLDDLAKVRRKRSLGISGKTKMSLQLLLVLVVGWVAIRFAGVDSNVHVPLLNKELAFGGVYFLVVYFVISGFANSVNITDGLDGLAAGTVATCLLAYTGITFMLHEPDLAILSASLMGACVGFLWYNSVPAEVFMGDTGSLALGAALAGLAVVTGTELLLVVIGGIFVVEALSVIIQVISFRVFKRRVFLMAPIHHHFELKDWSETKIIVRFWIVTAIFAAAGFTIFYVDTL